MALNKDAKDVLRVVRRKKAKIDRTLVVYKDVLSYETKVDFEIEYLLLSRMERELVYGTLGQD